MALEGFKARIAMLLDEMGSRPEGAHEVQERIREQLAEMRAMGMPLPDDLVALERSLEEALATREPPRPRGPAGRPSATGAGPRRKG